MGYCISAVWCYNDADGIDAYFRITEQEQETECGIWQERKADYPQRQQGWQKIREWREKEE